MKNEKKDPRMQLNVKIKPELFEHYKKRTDNFDLTGQQYIEQLISNDINSTDRLDNLYRNLENYLIDQNVTINVSISQFLESSVKSAIDIISKNTGE